MTNEITLVPAGEAKVGQIACEGDGFMWRIAAITETAKMVKIEFSPVYTTCLRQRPNVKAIRKYRLLRIANVEGLVL